MSQTLLICPKCRSRISDLGTPNSLDVPTRACCLAAILDRAATDRKELNGISAFMLGGDCPSLERP